MSNKLQTTTEAEEIIWRKGTVQFLTVFGFVSLLTLIFSESWEMSAVGVAGCALSGGIAAWKNL